MVLAPTNRHGKRLRKRYGKVRSHLFTFLEHPDCPARQSHSHHFARQIQRFPRAALARPSPSTGCKHVAALVSRRCGCRTAPTRAGDLSRTQPHHRYILVSDHHGTLQVSWWIRSSPGRSIGRCWINDGRYGMRAATCLTFTARSPASEAGSRHRTRMAMGYLSCADPINQLAAAELPKRFGRD
jgi:hypothetical protein